MIYVKEISLRGALLRYLCYNPITERFQCDGELEWNEYYQQYVCSKCHKTTSDIEEEMANEMEEKLNKLGIY